MNSSMAYWWLWDVAVPGVLIALFWAVHSVFLGSATGFQDAFQDGEPLLFGSLLLFGCAVQVKQREEDWKARGLDGDLSIVREVARAGGLIVIVCYALIRAHSLLTTGASLDLRTGFACFSWSAAFLAVAMAWYAQVKAERCAQGRVPRRGDT